MRLLEPWTCFYELHFGQPFPICIRYIVFIHIEYKMFCSMIKIQNYCGEGRLYTYVVF